MGRGGGVSRARSSSPSPSLPLRAKLRRLLQHTQHFFCFISQDTCIAHVSEATVHSNEWFGFRVLPYTGHKYMESVLDASICLCLTAVRIVTNRIETCSGGFTCFSPSDVGTSRTATLEHCGGWCGSTLGSWQRVSICDIVGLFHRTGKISINLLHPKLHLI